MGTFIQKVASFFHLGRLPDNVRTQMISEGGILYLAEGIAETAIFTDFRSPGIYCSSRRLTLIGFFALSDHRIVLRANCYHEILINTTYDDTKFKGITFKTSKTDQGFLSLTFDAAGYILAASGQVEIRLHLPDSSMAVKILNQKGVCINSE